MPPPAIRPLIWRKNSAITQSSLSTMAALLAEAHPDTLDTLLPTDLRARAEDACKRVLADPGEADGWGDDPVTVVAA